jgi:hypothetical protein
MKQLIAAWLFTQSAVHFEPLAGGSALAGATPAVAAANVAIAPSAAAAPHDRAARSNPVMSVSSQAFASEIAPLRTCPHDGAACGGRGFTRA